MKRFDKIKTIQMMLTAALAVIALVIVFRDAELYQLIGCEGILSHQEWVSFDEALCVDKTIEIVAQINGKIRAKLMLAADADKDEVLALAKADAAVAKDLDGKNIIKEIYVPGKLVNIVAK